MCKQRSLITNMGSIEENDYGLYTEVGSSALHVAAATFSVAVANATYLTLSVTVVTVLDHHPKFQF